MALGKLHVTKKTTEDIRAPQHPTTALELGSLLESRNIYRSIVLNFAKLAAQLNKKLMKGELLQIDLDEVEMKAVDVLKDKLISPLVPASSKSNGQYTIETDTCNTQVGCLLLRQQ